MNLRKSAVAAAVVSLLAGLSMTNVMAKDPAAGSAKEAASGVDSGPVKAKGVARQAKVRKPVDPAVKVVDGLAFVRGFASLPHKKVPPVMVSGGNAVALFPKAAKNDFMASDGSAAGILLVRDEGGSWRGPIFITMSGGSLGWQIVVDPLDIMLIFRQQSKTAALLKGNLVLNSRVAIEPGWLGPNLKGAPARLQKAEIVSYIRSRGEFVEDSNAAGTTLKIADDLNRNYYGKPTVSLADILSGALVKQDADLRHLEKLLNEYAAVKEPPAVKERPAAK